MSIVIITFFVNFALCFVFMTHPIFGRIVKRLESKNSLWITDPFYTGLALSPISCFLVFRNYSMFLSISGYALMLAVALSTAIIAEVINRLKKK